MSCGGRPGLDAAERALVDALGAGDRPPFLGHHELPAQVAQQLTYEIRQGVGRIEKRLRVLFYNWPALTTAWIARTVAERYGTISLMEVYPHLADLFGVADLDPNSRRRIAQQFRHACKRLDLPLPETGEPVDFYVVQAGVPHAQIEWLAEALAKAERQVGLPDIDDDMAVAAFAEVAASQVDLGHPRLRKVIEHDAVGWYPRLWITLREHPEEAPDDDFTRRLANAATTAVSGRSAQLTRPSLAWREGLLAVDVPQGQNRRWTLSALSWHQEVVGQAVPVTVPLPLPWPAAVEWQSRSPVRRKEDSGSLQLALRDSIAVFGATGRLVTRGSFGPSDEPTRPIRSARGVYDLLSVTAFLEFNGLEAICVPGGWHLQVELRDEPITLLRGGRCITLVAIQRPDIELLGPVLRDLHGRSIYADQAVYVRIRWPQAENQEETSASDEEAAIASLERSRQLVRETYEVLVEIAGKTLPPLPVSHRTDEEVALDLGPHLDGMEPVLRRVVLKLVRRGERRPLARTAAFVWVGLRPSDQSPFVGRRPANLSAVACANLDINEHRVALRADRPYAAARLVVDDVDGSGRREVFEFAYPGVLAVLRWLDSEGARREQILERDDVVALRPGDTRLLEVTSPDPGATLIVGSDVRPGTFRYRPRVGIPLTTVADACRGGADRLTIRGSDGIDLPLARFTVPCEVRRWVETMDRSRGERVLLLGFGEPLDRLRIRGRDLWHDQGAAFELAPDGLRQRAASGITFRLQPDHSGPGSSVRLVTDLHDWPERLWLFDLDARLGADSRWQALSNARGDAFAWLVSHGLDSVLAADLTSSLNFADRVLLFARCHKQLQRCFAQPCWEGGVKVILHLWHRLAHSIAADERLSRYWPAILPLAFVEPPLEASEGWLPLVSFWNVFPEFMALPGAYYSNLRQIDRDDTAVLVLLADLAAAGSVSRFLYNHHLLDVEFFACFTNLAKVHQSDSLIECRGFNFNAYVDRVRRAVEEGDAVGWAAGEPLLSASHYLSVLENLTRRYRTLASGYGNAHRIPDAARLVHDSIRWLDREGRALSETAIPDLTLKGNSLALPVTVEEHEDVLLQDAPTALSAIALACRLEPRRQGTLDAFMNSLAGADRDRAKVSADINFLTAAGRDLFAYWLLFWDVLLTTGE